MIKLSHSRQPPPQTAPPARHWSPMSSQRPLCPLQTHASSWPRRRRQHEQSKHTIVLLGHVGSGCSTWLDRQYATSAMRRRHIPSGCHTGYIRMTLASPLALRTPSRARPSFQPGPDPGDLAREAIRFCAESRTPITACSAKACAA